MTTIKRGIFAFIAGAALAMATGCAASRGHLDGTGPHRTSAIDSIGRNEAERQRVLNAQPLEATGGDLVLRHVVPRTIAG
jgi:hypothetical protein